MKRIFCLITIILIYSSGCNQKNSLKEQDNTLYVGTGWRCFAQEDFHESIKWFNEAIDNETDDIIEAYYGKGFIESYITKDNHSAITDFSQAIEINPKFAEAYYHRGLLYKRIQKYGNAIDDLTMALRFNRKWALAYYHRGLIRSENLKDYKGAINDFTKAIKFASIPDRVYIIEGVPKYIVFDEKGYFVDYTKPIEIKFPAYEYYMERGLAKFRMEQKDSGCSDIKKAMELGLPSGKEIYNEYCE